MPQLNCVIKRLFLFSLLTVATMSSGGCKMLAYGTQGALDYSFFWLTTPLIPVSPYWSQLIEDTYIFEERYGRAMVLDPVEGENAPLFCMDNPSPDEVMRSMPDETGGGFPFLAETNRNNVRIVVEPIVDRMEECRFYPMVGPARLHKCHYKCTVYYEKVLRSDWPIPFSHTDDSIEVVYIDHDHLIRCAGPGTQAF